MCGLVGMAGDLDKDDRSMFRQMLIVDAIRGHHSTGVAAAKANKDVSVFKKALSPLDFMQMRQYDDVVNWDAQVLIGHNRYATVGKINHATAHPFEHEGVVGAHNGTLKMWHSLPDSKNFGVDSECLIHNIGKHGFEETIPKVLGAYALTVYNQKEHTLSMLRNKERPLYFALKEGQKVLYWASEAWMIRNMAARCGIKIDGQIMAVKENHLVEFTLPDTKAGSKLTEPKVTKLSGAKEKKYTPPRQTHYNGRPNSGGQATYRNGTNAQAGASNSYNRNSNAADMGISIGSKVSFVPMSLEKSGSGTCYIEGVMSDAPWYNTRVYVHDVEKAQDILDNWAEVEGEVNALSPENRPTFGDEAYVVMTGTSLRKLADMQTATKALGEVLYTNGPGNTMLNREEFAERTKHGCGYCQADLDFDDTIEWVGNDPLCEDCVPTFMNNGKLH